MLETTTDNNRMTNGKAGLALAAVATIAVLAMANLARGRPPRPSFFLIVIVIFCAAGTWVNKETLLRLAFAIGGIQAAVRLVLWFAHAPYIWQWLVAVSGEITIVFAAIMVIFVRWPMSTNGERSSPDSERSTS